MRKRKPSTKNVPSRQLAELVVESLEPRVLLAGNVTASLSGGTLTVLGDNNHNTVQVSTFYNSYKGWGFKVQGQDNCGPTTINGTNYKTFFGVTNLKVDLKGGNDDFALTNNLYQMLCCLGYSNDPGPSAVFSEVVVAGWVVIQGGDGSNRIGLGQVDIGQHLLIQGGSGCDEVGLCETDVGTNIDIQTFAGDDKVKVFESKSVYSTEINTSSGDSCVEVEEFCGLDLIVYGGNDDDNVSIACVFIDDDLIVHTLNGCDDVQIVECCDHRGGESATPTTFEEDCCCEYVNYIGDLLQVQLGNGNNFLEIVATSAGTIDVLGGIDGDEIEIECVETEFDIKVNTLDGCDIVDIDDIQVRSLIVDTGSGDDEVTVENEVCANLFRDDLTVRTGSGDDVVIIGPDFFGNFESYGGFGHQNVILDDLIVETGNDRDLIKVFGYEICDNVTINAGNGDDGCTYEGDRAAQFFNADFGVFLCDLEIGGNLTLMLGEGKDTASIDGVCVEKYAYIYGNGGNDQIDIECLDVGTNLYIYMGSGDDKLSIENSSAATARFYGEGGYDELCKDCNSFGAEYVYTFEQIYS